MKEEYCPKRLKAPGFLGNLETRGFLRMIQLAEVAVFVAGDGDGVVFLGGGDAQRGALDGCGGSGGIAAEGGVFGDHRVITVVNGDGGFGVLALRPVGAIIGKRCLDIQYPCQNTGGRVIMIAFRTRKWNLWFLQENFRFP